MKPLQKHSRQHVSENLHNGFFFSSLPLEKFNLCLTYDDSLSAARTTLDDAVISGYRLSNADGSHIFKKFFAKTTSSICTSIPYDTSKCRMVYLSARLYTSIILFHEIHPSTGALLYHKLKCKVRFWAINLRAEFTSKKKNVAEIVTMDVLRHGTTGLGSRASARSRLSLILLIISAVKCYFRLYSPRNWKFRTIYQLATCDDRLPRIGLSLPPYTLTIHSVKMRQSVEPVWVIIVHAYLFGGYCLYEYLATYAVHCLLLRILGGACIWVGAQGLLFDRGQCLKKL
ncbi:hypothetical protein TNCV_3748051 [Trichonephila clavipes]|nr:hypothetical protein TNCV_3748051 [Trichonephila clavipes]